MLSSFKFIICVLFLLILNCACCFAQNSNPWGGREGATLQVNEVNGAPGWLLNDKPYTAIFAQAGRGGFSSILNGRLHIESSTRINALLPEGIGESFSVTCTMSVDTTEIPDTGIYMEFVGETAEGKEKRYPIKLGYYENGICGVMNWTLPNGSYVVRQPIDKKFGEPVRLRFAKDNDILSLEADGKLLGQWTDPAPMKKFISLTLASYIASGSMSNLSIETLDGKQLFAEKFADDTSARKHFTGDFPPLGPPAKSSFFSAGIPVYTTWEWGPEMHTVWREDGSFDWWEVDQYLRRIAAYDPNGLLNMRFNFGTAPVWWAAQHPDQMVHLRRIDGANEVTSIASFASEEFWQKAEEAARDLGRYAKQHPEGWRLVGMTYSGGICEFFPQITGNAYSDYSPAYVAGFRKWLAAKYQTDEKLQNAWKNETVTLETAELPTPEQRLKGDWFELYDPALGMQKVDFCSYYAEVTSSLITRLAKAFKDGSDGRFYTRPMTGYQPQGGFFRVFSGSHADFSTVLNCPWVDGFFMPHDYNGRGYGGYTSFEIPVASVQLHGKTYITEMDDRTHRLQPAQASATETPWQTTQSIRRNIGTALCYSVGAEFKDWAYGWFDDEPTMDVIREMNNFAQESVKQDRTQTAEIAVIINPRSTKYVRDDSNLYTVLNAQQKLMTYPRVGAPYDQVMIDDLDIARDYRLYIVQDCMYLTDAEYQLIKDKICRNGKTVLWIFAPGIVSDNAISVDRVSELVGMKLNVYDTRERLHLKITNNTHPYTQELAGNEYPTNGGFGPLLYVEDSTATTLGMGWYSYGVNKPCFAVKQMPCLLYTSPSPRD